MSRAWEEHAYLYCPRLHPALIEAIDSEFRAKAAEGGAASAIYTQAYEEFGRRLRDPRGKDLCCPAAVDLVTARELARAVRANDREQVLHVYQSHPGAIGLQGKGTEVLVLPDDPAAPESRNVRILYLLTPKFAGRAGQTDCWVAREYVVSWDPDRR